MVRYYSTERPVSVGTYPKPASNHVLGIENFESKRICEEIGREAWGYIDYEHSLTIDFENAEGYELVAVVDTVHTLRFLGLDDWSRRVYIDEAGKIWKDTDVFNKPPLRHSKLTSALYNAFGGEPDWAMRDNEDYIILEDKEV